MDVWVCFYKMRVGVRKRDRFEMANVIQYFDLGY